MKTLRLLRRLLNGKLYEAHATLLSSDWVTRHRKLYVEAALLVKIFYVISIYILITALVQDWNTWFYASAIAPIWPLAWAGVLPVSFVFSLIAFSIVASSLLAALFCENRYARLFFAVSLFEFAAFTNSFGKINHGWHTWVIVALLLCALPHRNWNKVERTVAMRQPFLVVFAAVQFTIMLFYSMSGFWKAYVGARQLVFAQINMFHPEAFAYILADHLLKTNIESPLGALIINFPLLGWPLYPSAVYVELFAVVAVFRPSLHRLWGLALITFHIGTYLFMNIAFTNNILLLGIFFLLSPYRPQSFSLSRLLFALPLFGDIAYFVHKKNAMAAWRMGRHTLEGNEKGLA